MGIFRHVLAWSPYVIHKGVIIDLRDEMFSPRIKRSICNGKYEASEAKAARRHVAPGQTVLEIGSGCGFLSSYIARLGRGNTLHCVEANPKLIPVILRQHRLNRVTAHVYNEILAEEAGESEFYLHDDFWSSSSERLIESEKITVRRTRFIDRLLEWRPECVIMDIEGGEMELLALGLPEFVRTLILEVHEHVYGPAGVRRVMACISDLGFAYAPKGSTGHVLCYRRL